MKRTFQNLARDELRLRRASEIAIFDGITQIAATVCGASTAYVVLEAAEQQWFTPHDGLADAETSRKLFGLCQRLHATRSIVVIPDLLEVMDVVKDPDSDYARPIRFFAFVRLMTSDGLTSGFLCVIDSVPRTLGPAQKLALRGLARQVVREIGSLHLNVTMEALGHVQNNFIFGADIKQSFDGLLQTLISLTQSRDAVIGQISPDEEGDMRIETYSIVNPVEPSKSDGTIRPPLHEMWPLLDRVSSSMMPFILQVESEGGEPETFLGIPLRRLDKTIGIVGLIGRLQGYTPEIIREITPCFVTCTVIMEACQAEIKRTITEELLLTEKTRLDVTLSNIKDGVIVTSPDGAILLINGIAETLSGWTAAEALGKIITDVLQIGSMDSQITSNPLSEALRTPQLGGSRILGAPVLLTPKGGEITDVVLAVWPLQIIEDRAADLLIIIRDVSEAMELEEMKANFISVVSHELRTPLTSICGFTSTIVNDPEMQASVRNEFLKIIQSEALRLNTLVEKVVDFTKSTRLKNRRQRPPAARKNGQDVSSESPLPEKVRQGDASQHAGDSDQLQDAWTISQEPGGEAHGDG